MTKPLLIKQESNSTGSLERTVHKSVTQSPNSADIEKIITQLGGIEGIMNTIERIQNVAQTISPILPLLGSLLKKQKATRKRSVSPKQKQRTKRKK